MAKYALPAAALALALTACSGAGPGLPTTGSQASQLVASGSASRHKGHARFEIRIPKKKRHRGARYISPATKSLQIAIQPVGGGASIVKKINVTAGTLDVTVQLNPGKYLATVATYDGLNESGNCLSSGQALPFELVAGKDTEVTLTLGGVVHSFLIAAEVASGSAATGFTAYGSTPQVFVVAGIDADGYYIIGAGAPQLNVSVTGAGWSVTPKETSKASPNRFLVTPSGIGGSIGTVTLAVADPSLCTLAGSACTTTFTLKDTTAALYVAVCGASCGGNFGPDKVVIFAAPYTGQPIATITNGISSPTDVAVDKSGNVFVLSNPLKYAGSNDLPSVKEYSPANNYASPIATMTSGLEYPTRVALNPAGDVIVMNGMNDTYDYPAIFTAASHYTADPITIKMHLSQVNDMRVNAQGTIVVASCGVSCGHTFDDGIVQFPAPYSSGETPVSLSTVDPLSLTIDPKGNLWVGECQGCTAQASDVVEHLPQPGETNLYSSSIANMADETNDVDGPVAIAVDASQNLIVAGAYTGNYPGVRMYAPPYTATPTALFGQPVITRQLDVDASGELVMWQDYGSTSVVVSQPPYSTYTDIVDEYSGAAVLGGEATRYVLAP